MSEITWYGHSAFKISAPQAHVVIDPFFTPASGVNAESLGLWTWCWSPTTTATMWAIP